MLRVMAQRGVDHQFGRRLFGELRDLGLNNVASEGKTSVWTATTPGTSILRANFEQLRDDMLRGGFVTEQEFERDLAAMDDSSFRMPSPIVWSAWGQRP
jgi:hypothetical protein